MEGIFVLVTDNTLALGQRNVRSKARIWDRSLFMMVPKKNARADKDGTFKPEDMQFTGAQGFQTFDGHQYAVHMSGAFVRLDKDRRSVKERKGPTKRKRVTC